MSDNNRGNSTPPTPGSDQPAQSSVEVRSIDRNAYAPERIPSGYNRVSTVPEKTDPC